MEETKIRNNLKEFFLNLLLLVTLYVSAGYFFSLAFDCIDYLFPERAQEAYLNSYSVRWSIASLVVAFPAFLATSFFLEKIYAKEPEKRNMKFRKWFMYLTMFLASLMTVDDLVFLIYGFLSGEMTVKFLLKALTVLAVGGIVFLYSLKEKDSSPKVIKSLGLASTALILAALSTGLYLSGSPYYERSVRMDQQRVNDLMYIKTSIENYWASSKKLPQKLEDSATYLNPPRDPEDNSPYEYNILSENKFALCANFKTKSEFRDYPSWDHPKGKHCFERTVKKD